MTRSGRRPTPRATRAPGRSRSRVDGPPPEITAVVACVPAQPDTPYAFGGTAQRDRRADGRGWRVALGPAVQRRALHVSSRPEARPCRSPSPPPAGRSARTSFVSGPDVQSARVRLQVNKSGGTSFFSRVTARFDDVFLPEPDAVGARRRRPWPRSMALGPTGASGAGATFSWRGTTIGPERWPRFTPAPRRAVPAGRRSPRSPAPPC